MEAWSWFMVDRNAPDWYKKESRRAYLACFGTSGMFEQDDMENWTSITAVAKGHLAARQQLDSTMGMAPGGGTRHEPVAELARRPGRPMSASASTANEPFWPTGPTISFRRRHQPGTGMTTRPRADPALLADVSAWLFWEAELLDQRRYRDWLGVLTEDITYRMPVRVTTANGTARPGPRGHGSLRRRPLHPRPAGRTPRGTARWTEDPPSRTRRFVTNVRVTPPVGSSRPGRTTGGGSAQLPLAVSEPGR